jgi:hypothetical protein
MSAHHLKSELLFLPGKACPLQDLSITFDNSSVPLPKFKEPCVTLDNTVVPYKHQSSDSLPQVRALQHPQSLNIAQEAVQALIQVVVVSHLDYLNSLLAGLPACAI